MEYTKLQKEYIYSVDGAAHQSAIEIIGSLERKNKTIFNDAVEESARCAFVFLYEYGFSMNLRKNLCDRIRTLLKKN